MTNDEAAKLIGLRVAKYRKLKKFTVRELGKKCNLSHSYISGIENAVNKATDLNTLSIIAEALDVSLDNLLEDCLVKYDNYIPESKNKDLIEKINLILDTLSEKELEKISNSISLISDFDRKHLK